MQPAPKGTLRSLMLHLFLLMGSVVMMLPFLWQISTSLKGPGEVFTYPIQWLPSSLNWDNYTKLFTTVPMARYIFNSLFVAVAATWLELLVSSLAAFAFARLRFRGRDQLFWLYVATLMIPGQVTLIPSFIIIRELGWYDTYQALIVPGAFSAFSTFFLRQYFRRVPRELDEAARIDGASSFFIWLRIVLPLSKPALAALMIFSFLGQWNSFLWPLIVTISPEMRTLPIGLTAFQGEFGVDWELLMAGTVIATLPVIVLYSIGQKWIVDGINLSGSS